MSRWLSLSLAGALVSLAGCGLPESGGPSEDGLSSNRSALSSLSSNAAPNSAGIADTIHSSGSIDTTNPFFDTSLSTNGRSCESCHSGQMGWTLSPKAALFDFIATDGLGPLFRLHDAGSRPDASLATRGDRVQAFKDTLVKKGLIRFTRAFPANAEFTMTAVDDPSGWSTTTSWASFRRPTPTANQTKAPTITWTGGPHLVADAVLATSGGAARFHGALAAPPPLATQQAMRDFQIGVFFAQAHDDEAGALDAAGALGGPAHLMAQPFYVGINDIQGNDPQGHAFTRNVFTLFDAWKNADQVPGSGQVGQARARIARGQELFNNYEFDISGVAGLNDLLGQPVVRGTCATCHNAPNVGSHSVARWFDIGTADEANRAPEITLLTVQNKTTGEVRRVTDLGRAQNTGRWTDIGRFRAPPLRGLAARAPYFHDGQADDLKDVVKYYDQRFNMNLSGSEKQDLEAFLKAL